MVLKVIKEFFNSSIFNGIKYGDIIYAKRYDNKKEFLNIPSGHRQGPFIVISKTKRKLYCISGSGNCIHKKDLYYIVNSTNYKLKKKTYFYLLNVKILKKKHYLNKIDTLNSEDKNELIKQILSLKNTKKCPNIKLKNVSYKLLVGDIIKVFNKYYVVLDIDKKIICFNVKYKKKIMPRDINLKKICYIEKDNNIKYINKMDNQILNFIFKKYQELLYINSHKNKPTRGSIINHEENYYFIYGEESKVWLVIKIVLNFKKTYKQIKLSNKTIYTKFEEHKINKNIKFSIVELLNSSDIEIIKLARKNNKKVIKKEKVFKNKTIKIGSIIMVVNNSLETFQITNIIGNIIECISTADKGTNKFYFNKEKIKLVK